MKVRQEKNRNSHTRTDLNNSLFTKSSYVEDEHEEGLVGVGGKETITLTPLKAGKTEVTLTYARPWEGGEQADQIIYVFNIDKNLQAETVDLYSMGVNETLPTPELKIN